MSSKVTEDSETLCLGQVHLIKSYFLEKIL